MVEGVEHPQQRLRDVSPVLGQGFGHGEEKRIGER
jgi:hypothetical protein